MKRLLIKYPATFYYITVMLVSILLVIPMMITNSQFVQVQYAPAIGVLIFFLILGKSDCFKPLRNSMKLSYGLLKWIFLTIAITLAATVVISSALAYKGMAFSIWKSDVPGYFSVTLQIFVGVILEEIGWRGFLLPLFSSRYSLFKSSVFVGLLWGIWHIPAYSSFGFIGCMSFFTAVIMFSIFISFFYAKGEGSLILAVTAHFFINIFSQIILAGRMSTATLILYAVIYGMVGTVIVIAGKETFFKRVCR